MGENSITYLHGDLGSAKPQSTEEMSVAAWLRGKKVLL